MKTLFKKKLNCCICFSRENSIFFKKIDNFELYTCKKCQLTYLDSIECDPAEFMTDASQPDPNVDYWGYPKIFEKYKSIFQNFFEERFKRLSQYNPPLGKWLDIGCGFGLWQMHLQNKGIPSLGLEIEANAFAYTQNLKLDVIQKSFEEFESAELFSVITVCDVLEHVENPVDFIKKCERMLKSGGLLYIQVPDVLGIKIPFGDSLGLPHHLWQFNKNSLKKVLNHTNLQKMNDWTGIQGIISYHENGRFSLFHQFLWNISNVFKIGNRLQFLYKKV